MTAPRKILFVAEAVTLAHVARTHALAASLDRDRFEVCVAADPRYDALFRSPPYATRPLATIATERFEQAIRKGSPIYDVDTLAGYVDDDLRAIDDFGPDVIVGDFRLSLSVSARLSGTPYVTVTNAGWSPFADIRFVVPDLPMNRWVGIGIAQRLFDLARPIAFAAHARPVNRLRSRFGLPPLGPDIRAAYTDADFILYADLPELFSMRTMPESHGFLGPVQWSPSLPLPSWWHDVPADAPVVYVTLGSSGRASVLPPLIAALATLPVSVLVATAGRVALQSLPSNVYVADYLPGDVAAARASVVVCNGGSPTCYQAFESGTPVIGIPTNLDQYLNMQAVSATAAGAMLRPSQIRAVRPLVESLARDGNHRRQAERLREACAKSRPADVLARTLAKAADSRRPAESPATTASSRRPVAKRLAPESR